MQIANKQIHTEINRYPLLFGNAYLFRTQNMSKQIKILSFGCSTGEEISTLNEYFSDDLIFGCDINLDAVKVAQNKFRNFESIMIFESNLNNLEKYGPFDIIFANSVLCINTNKSNILKEGFPFHTFESIILNLARLLSNQGILCLYNTSYFPDESDIFNNIVSPIKSHFVSMGYIPRFNRDTLLVLDRVVESGRGYYVRKNEKNINCSIANVFFTHPQNVSNYMLDYSKYSLWTEMGYDVTVPQNLHNISENIIWEKIIYHYSKEYINGELFIHPGNKKSLGKTFLPQILFKIPDNSEGFISLFRY